MKGLLKVLKPRDRLLFQIFDSDDEAMDEWSNSDIARGNAETEGDNSSL